MHGLRTGAGYITGLFLQWQNGEQVNMWPAKLAKGKLAFPTFVKVGQSELTGRCGSRAKLLRGFIAALSGIHAGTTRSVSHRA